MRELTKRRSLPMAGRWRNRKGIARIRLSDGSIHVAALNWQEAAGIGRQELKIKHRLRP
jgi:hypothetical protein